MHLKIDLPTEKNYTEAAKKHTNHRMWSARQKATKTMWSGTDQITWSNYVVEAENHTSFLPPQVLYCNLEKRICQVIL